MGTVNDPGIEIAWLDGVDWVDVSGYAKSFSVSDAGVFGIPLARIKLLNKGGRYTQGADQIDIASQVRIRADVRGEWDRLFKGYYIRYEGDKTSRKHDITIVCVGALTKLLWETITYPYADRVEAGDIWTMETMIENFLANPDSGVATGISLSHDEGAITTELPLDNYQGTKLLHALQRCAEKLGYGGYMDGVATLTMKAVGTVAVDPAITLTEPYVFLRPVFDIQEVRNCIFPWGDVEVGTPPSLDDWTQAHDRWANLWTGEAGVTVSTETGVTYAGGKAIKIANASTYNPDATLDIEQDPDFAGGVDVSTGRFAFLSMMLRHAYIAVYNIGVNIELEDSGGNRIKWGPGNDVSLYYQELYYDRWLPWKLPVNTAQIQATAALGYYYKQWYYTNGSSFDWNICKIRIDSPFLTADPSYLLVDALCFEGGKRIDPINNAAYYPTVPPLESATSIANYMRRVYHEHYPDIRTFKQAVDAGTRSVDTMREAVKKIVAKKGAAPYARPNETLTVTAADYGVVAETWRIHELKHEWKQRGNLLRTTYTLIPQSAVYDTRNIRADTVGGQLAAGRR